MLEHLGWHWLALAAALHPATAIIDDHSPDGPFTLIRGPALADHIALSRDARSDADVDLTAAGVDDRASFPAQGPRFDHYATFAQRRGLGGDDLFFHP